MMKNFNPIMDELDKRGISLSVIEIAEVRPLVERWLDGICGAYLAPAEISCLEEMKVPKRKTDFISGRLAGKQAVVKLIHSGRIIAGERDVLEYGCKSIEIRKARTGVPLVFIENAPGKVRISISHSPSYAAGAVCAAGAYRGIGIDLERIERRHESIYDVALVDDEKILIRRCEERRKGEGDEKLAQYWSIKEAVLKAMGIGLNVDLRDIKIIERTDGAFRVDLKSETQKRFDDLGASRMNVASYRVADHYLSVACLH